MRIATFKKAVSLSLMFTLLAGMCGCGAPKTVPIEVSETKIEVEIDEKATVEIENYDELKDVTIEIDDDDIAKIKDKEGKITITGLEEGKTKIIISASNAESDITIKVVVNAPEEPEPEPVIDTPVVDPEPEPEPEPDPEPVVSTGSVDDWYGSYSGYIYLTGTDSWSDEYYYWDDVTAEVGQTADGRDYFEGFSDDMDLWDLEWSKESNYPIFTFWVELTDDKMTADKYNDAWILDENDLSDYEYDFYWYDFERDYLMLSYDYYDEQYGGGYEVLIVLEKD